MESNMLSKKSTSQRFVYDREESGWTFGRSFVIPSVRFQMSPKEREDSRKEVRNFKIF